jgi:hypothetical protein
MQSFACMTIASGSGGVGMKKALVLRKQRRCLTLGIAGQLRAALEASDPVKDAPGAAGRAARPRRGDQWPE